MKNETDQEPKRDGSLPWARLDGQASAGEDDNRFPWAGWGLLSDNGLPFDAMQMLLAAKELHSSLTPGIPVRILLPDRHAESNGVDPDVVRMRGDRLREDVGRLADLLEMPIEVIRSSELVDTTDFRRSLREVDRWIRSTASEGEVSEYTRLGMADVLFMSSFGGVKVGWSISPDICAKGGRNHEPRTDLLAQQIAPSVSAVYVPHGCRMDRKRPRSAPYLEMHDTAARFMLTGPDANGFRRKSELCQGEGKAYLAAMNRCDETVRGFERIVRPIQGHDSIEKAEWIASVVSG